MDSFFRAWNFVDTSDCMFLLIPFIWIGYHRKLGLQIFYCALLSSFLNAGLKELFQVSRPFWEHPPLGIVEVKGYSFPSGAAQTAIWLPALFIQHFRSRSAWILGILFWACLSFSRVYLGVHYPLDILGGWVVGALALLLLSDPGLYKKYRCWWGRTSHQQRLLLSISLAGLLLLHPSGKGDVLSALLLGCQLGLVLNSNDGQADLQKTNTDIFLRGVFGTTGAIFLSGMPSMLLMPGLSAFKILSTFCSLTTGFWLSFAGSYCYDFFSNSQKTVDV
jgi:hypothetical protein